MLWVVTLVPAGAVAETDDGEAMTMTVVTAYAYDEIDQARAVHEQPG
jgi:hypothetical protein